MNQDPSSSLTSSARRAHPWSSVALQALRALRPEQWSKNIILAVPVLAAHRLGDPVALLATMRAALAFCLVASAGYVVNDLVDLEADRAHPRKRRRPFASGAPRELGFALVPALLLAAALAAADLPRPFALCLAGYLAATLSYSFVFRRRAVLDVIALAAMYTARIFAGGFAAHIPVSEWLTTFSLFFFLSLAFLKRAAELEEAPRSMAARGYHPPDQETVAIMGVSSGLMSVVVFTLYLASPEVARLYSHPRRLWAVCPLMLYWVAHQWMQARRGRMRGDPVVLALTDRVTLLVGVLGTAVILWAM